jgi:dihydroorotate dehydrogenase
VRTFFRRSATPEAVLDRFRLIAPLLGALDPETAHDLTLWALRRGLGPRGGSGSEDPILTVSLWGRRFPNPLGLAAGFDKNASVIGPMLDLGFGFVELGSVTPRPQPGNPRPRVFRVARDRAVINRMGFPGAGLEVAARNLSVWRAGARGGLLGVNLGMNKETKDAAADYVAGVRALAPLADYLAINVSSPNTPGLRALQGRSELVDLIVQVRAARDEVCPGDAPPLLVKIAPDLGDTERSDIAEVALGQGIEGLIVSNTTLQRPGSLRGRHGGEAGGLSGQPLFEPATALLSDMYRLTGGQVPLIGVGGVSGPDQAYAKIRAGASLVQLYTALVYEGPGLVARIKAGLAGRLRADGFASVAEAVGVDCQ